MVHGATAGIHAPQYGCTWQKRFSFCAISGHELALLYCYYYYMWRDLDSGGNFECLCILFSSCLHIEAYIWGEGEKTVPKQHRCAWSRVILSAAAQSEMFCS